MVYWVACYKDGRQIKQDDSQSYDSLDRINLEAFVLMFEDKDILTIWLDDNRQLIWRLRRELTPGVGEQRVHLTGWREQSGSQTLCYIFEQYNGLGGEIFPIIHISGKYNRERNRFMYGPSYREFEVFPGETWYSNRQITHEDGSIENIQESHIKE